MQQNSCSAVVYILFILRYFLHYVFIIDNLGGIYIFRKSDTVIMKCHDLIQAMIICGEDLQPEW